LILKLSLNYSLAYVQIDGYYIYIFTYYFNRRVCNIFVLCFDIIKDTEMDSLILSTDKVYILHNKSNNVSKQLYIKVHNNL